MMPEHAPAVVVKAALDRHAGGADVIAEFDLSSDELADLLGKMERLRELVDQGRTAGLVEMTFEQPTISPRYYVEPDDYWERIEDSDPRFPVFDGGGRWAAFADGYDPIGGGDIYTAGTTRMSVTCQHIRWSVRDEGVHMTCSVGEGTLLWARLWTCPDAEVGQVFQALSRAEPRLALNVLGQGLRDDDGEECPRNVQATLTPADLGALIVNPDPSIRHQAGLLVRVVPEGT